jgi:hypothetical protein
MANNNKTLKDRLKRYSEELYNFYKNYTGITILVSIGIGVYGVIILDEYINKGDIYKHNLPAISQIATAIGVIFSGVAIILLYKNYRLQQEEMNKLTKGNLKANDLQIILYEKQIFKQEYQQLLSQNGSINTFEKQLISFRNDIETISENATATETRINVNRLLSEQYDFRKEIVVFIFILNKKFSLLKKEIYTKSSLNLFVTSMDKHFVQLLISIYRESTKVILHNYNERECTDRTKSMLNALKEITQETNELKIVVNNYKEFFNK